MKPTPLLEMWQKPDGAGDPVGVLATTFALDPDFFERNCIARFLALESINEGTGSAEDLVAKLELEEGLRAPMVTVLTDRSAPAERSSLRWDLLHCHVSSGLLHSKVAVLLWEHAARVIIGSANLTTAGYRHNIELAMAADLGPNCLLPKSVLAALADELESYLDLVPGLAPRVPAHRQAMRILQHFRKRIDTQGIPRTRVLVALAPTNEHAQPLDAFSQVWSGPQPLEATQASPYWDAKQSSAITSVSKLLTGRPAHNRKHRVAVTIGPGGEISFPPGHRAKVDEIHELGPLDKNPRTLHAKALVVKSSQWIATLFGSSNHTIAGLGLGTASDPRHRELNVWIGAPLDSKEGKTLRDLIPRGMILSDDFVYEAPDDEDEPNAVAPLPSFFQLCRLSRDGEIWRIDLMFGQAIPPKEWRVCLPNGELLVDSHAWFASGGSKSFSRPINPANLPMFLDVSWDASKTTWAVIADDRHALPPGLGLSDLQSEQLLDALANGKTVAQVLREKLERDALASTRVTPTGIVTDPLKRFDSRSSLLRRGRALANALTALEARLSRPVTTLDALEARLSGPLGPLFIADRLFSEFLEGAQPRSETLFTLAEVALSVGRVPWAQAMRHIDLDEGIARVCSVLESLDQKRIQIGSEPPDLAQYAARAIQESKACINY